MHDHHYHHDHRYHHHDHHGHHGAMSPELTELARFQECEGNATHSPLHTTPVFNALRTFYSRLVIYWLIDALEKAAMICKACLHCAHLHFSVKIVYDSNSSSEPPETLQSTEGCSNKPAE